MDPDHTPPRSVRVPNDLWKAAKVKAAAERTTVTAVIIAALTEFTKTPPTL